MAAGQLMTNSSSSIFHPPSCSTSFRQTCPRINLAKMPMRTESNACRACAKSKRKCGRQLPSCTRCLQKGIGDYCVYPLSRSKAPYSSRPLLPNDLSHQTPGMGDAFFAEFANSPSSCTSNLVLTDDLLYDFAVPQIDIDFSDPASFIQTPPTPPTVRTDWFLAPHTWTISHDVDYSAAMLISKAMMRKYVAGVQSWFERWVKTGSNVFIHARLYEIKLPTSLQVANATLTSYIHRTDENTDSILQSVEDRSNDLLLENGAVVEDANGNMWFDTEEQNPDLFAQLARLHALLVYQTIGLFDGDIRSRHVAECRMAVQDSWTNKLYQSAANILPKDPIDATLLSFFPEPQNHAQQQWHLWILSESIRRTWLISLAVSRIFATLQQRRLTCPGSIMYTNRAGLWNAASAFDWDRRCSEGGVAFLQRQECGKLFDNAEPADIDEFGTAILNLSCHIDLLQQWRDRTAHNQ